MSDRTTSIIIIGAALGSLVLLYTILGTVIMLVSYEPIERTPHETTAQSYERIKPIHSEAKVYKKQAKPIHHYQAPTTENKVAEETYTCPEGTEPIGSGACRITPTGCPWGDSIPMDKCEESAWGVE